jgi:hypothetical protein
MWRDAALETRARNYKTKQFDLIHEWQYIVSAFAKKGFLLDFIFLAVNNLSRS